MWSRFHVLALASLLGGADGAPPHARVPRQTNRCSGDWGGDGTCIDACGHYQPSGCWVKTGTKMRLLTLRYLGHNANDLINNRETLPRGPTGVVSQPDNKLAIDVPGPRGAEPVRISTSQSGLSPATHFDVMIGDTFTWTADSGRFAADLELTITDSTGRAHAVMFHSSCSYPLEVGDTYGSVQIVGHENSDGCVSGTTSPTVTPPTPPPTPPTPAPTLACCYEAACGRNNNPNCVEDPHCAVEEAIHEVRCCSDVFIGGWMQRGASCPWASSDAWASGCIDGMNHGEAAAHCAAEGARLCTKAELEADCTAYTGCTHDDDLIWTSTPHATSCSTSPPTNPPVQPTPPPTPPPTTRPPTSPPVQPTPLPTPPPTPPTLPPPTSPSPPTPGGIGGTLTTTTTADRDVALLEASSSGNSNSESNAESGTDDYWWLLLLPFLLFGFMFRSVRPDAASAKPATGAGPDGPHAGDVHATVLQSPTMASPGSIVNATGGTAKTRAAPATSPAMASASAAPYSTQLTSHDDPDIGSATTRGQPPSLRSPPQASGVGAPSTVPTSTARQHANPGDPDSPAGPGVPVDGISPSTARQHANPEHPNSPAGPGVPVDGISPSTAKRHFNPGTTPDGSNDADVATALPPAVPCTAATRGQAPSWRAQKFNLEPLTMDDIDTRTRAACPQGGVGGSTGAPGNIDKASVGAAPSMGAEPAGGVNAVPFSAVTMVRRAKREPNYAASIPSPSEFLVAPSNMTLKGKGPANHDAALGQSGPIGSETRTTNSNDTPSGPAGSGPGVGVSPANADGVPGSIATLKAVRMANPSFDNDEGIAGSSAPSAPTSSMNPADIRNAAGGTNPHAPSSSGLFAPPTRINSSSPSKSRLGDAPNTLLPGVTVPDQVALLASRLALMHDLIESLGEPDGLPPKGTWSKPLSKQVKSATKATASAHKALNAADKAFQRLPAAALGASKAVLNEYASANRGFKPLVSGSPGSPLLSSTNLGCATHSKSAGDDGTPLESTSHAAANACMDHSSSEAGSVVAQSPAENQDGNAAVNTAMPATPTDSGSSAATQMHGALLSKSSDTSSDQNDSSLLAAGAIVNNGAQPSQTGLDSQMPNGRRLLAVSVAGVSPALDVKNLKKLKNAFAACSTADKAVQQAADAWAAVSDSTALTATAGVEAVPATVMGSTPGIRAAIQMAERATNPAGDGNGGANVADEHPSRAGTNQPMTSVDALDVPRFLKANARHNQHARTNWRNPTTGEARRKPELEFAHSQDNNLRVKSVVRKNPLYRSSVAPSVVVDGANRISLMLDGSDTSTSQSDPIMVLEALQAQNEPDSIEARPRSASYANALLETDEEA